VFLVERFCHQAKVLITAGRAIFEVKYIPLLLSGEGSN